MASLMIMLCVSMLVGGTFALWTDNVEVVNHLQAGTLKVALTRTNLEQLKVDERGVLVGPKINNKEVDFTNGTTENIFGMDNQTKDEYDNVAGELIAPGSKYTADMKIKSLGSIAFTYEVYLQLLSGDEELAKQIQVTVTTYTTSENQQGEKVKTPVVTQMMLNDEELGRDKSNLGYNLLSGKILIGENAKLEDEFQISVEFINYNPAEPGKDNNTAQGKKAVFDLFVTAVQYTEVTSA